MPETAILLQKSIGSIKGARRAQGRAEGRKGGQEGRQGGQEGRSALLFWPSWNTVNMLNRGNSIDHVNQPGIGRLCTPANSYPG